MATTPVNGGKGSPIDSLARPTADANKAVGAKSVIDASTMPTPPSAASKRASANVDISADAKDRAAAQAKALQIARNTPDVREDRVASLKAQIDAGTYKVDAGKVADGMMREAIKEHLSEIDER
jgi:flagellar biosynthesis anti-sigma factor FlgM